MRLECLHDQQRLEVSDAADTSIAKQGAMRSASAATLLHVFTIGSSWKQSDTAIEGSGTATEEKGLVAMRVAHLPAIQNHLVPSQVDVRVWEPRLQLSQQLPQHLRHVLHPLT